MDSAREHADRLVLVTGASGYVGGRLLRALEERGERVRCLVRRPELLSGRVAPGTEVVGGDLLRRETLPGALAGVDAAYYLVHSLSSSDPFEERDRQAARDFGDAARDAGVARIVYLGGLGRAPDLSSHLASRQEVGRILRESGVPTIEFRAAIVIGSGGASFEIVRGLADRLPVMITPRWVQTRSQPIAVEDVLAYLVAALDRPAESVVYEIGGPDRVSYGELIREYARLRGLRRRLVAVPVLTPRLSSLWLGLVTPVYARIGRKLVDSLRNETVVEDDRARRDFPEITPRGYREAIARALANEDRAFAETRWSDEPDRRWGGRFGGVAHGSRLVDRRERFVSVAPAEAFAPIRRIGGRRGYYFGDALWRLRGFLDLLVGGAGLRRGRANPEVPALGSTLDFWRVEAYEEDRLLRLHAEMKVPGRAWLQFEVRGGGGGSTIVQTALFEPAGLVGRAYWYGLWPVHRLVFEGMLAGIARAAEKRHEAVTDTSHLAR